MAGFLPVSGYAASVNIGTATSGKNVPATCDVDFMKSMEARAWLEAEREIVQNQNLIFKADSVMEYTCFDKHLGVLVLYEGTLFSGGVAGGTVLTDMSKALTNVVGKALTGFVSKNFGHTFLGGRSADNPLVSGNISAAKYECDRMNVVWKEAKCSDFQEQAFSQDGFFTFAEYVSGPEKRQLPTACGKDPRWAQVLDIALTAPPWMPADWKNNKRPTYLNSLNPSLCAGIETIPTGVMVQLTGRANPYEERVCPAPGCWYDPDGSNKCQP